MYTVRWDKNGACGVMAVKWRVSGGRDKSSIRTVAWLASYLALCLVTSLTLLRFSHSQSCLDWLFVFHVCYNYTKVIKYFPI